MTPGLYATLVTLHVLRAAVWAGGHLVLTLGVLPGVLRRGDADFLMRFEAAFERVGLPALALQVASQGAAVEKETARVRRGSEAAVRSTVLVRR